MQSYTKDGIRNLLETNDDAVVRGVEAIYARQTADEKSSATTSHSNGRGFNGTDAYILTSFATQIAEWRAEKAETGRTRYPFPLSPKQLTSARRRILKYAGQLALVANEKAEAKAAKAAELPVIFPDEDVNTLYHEMLEEARVSAAERAAIQVVEVEDDYLVMA